MLSFTLSLKHTNRLRYQIKYTNWTKSFKHIVLNILGPLIKLGDILHIKVIKISPGLFAI